MSENKEKVLGQVRDGRLLFDAGKFEQAAAHAEAALAILPDHQAAKDLLADIAFRQGDFPKVIAVLRSLLERAPDNHVYHTKIAVAYAVQSELQTAAMHLRKAVQLNPNHLPACLDLCKVATELGEFDEAIQVGRHAINLNPRNPKAHDHIAMAYELYGFYDKAREHYELAARLSPNDGVRQYTCGMAYSGAVDEETARQYLKKSVGLLPRFAPPYLALARMNHYTSPEHEDFSKLKSLLRAPDITDNNRSLFHFALGKMYEDCELYEQAFEHFEAGNRIENRKHNYRPDAFHIYASRLIESFPADGFTANVHSGHPSRVPVFIVGMPRSGTTLVEQILSRHPDIFGAGELPWFIRCAHDLPKLVQSSRPYPECIAELGEKEAHMLGQKYLDYLVSLTEPDNYACITNKWPNNYERIGLIARIFPNARFIHCQRDPLDNLISQYTLMFPGSVKYSYNLFNLGSHYTQYERLMHHWKSAMPKRFFDIQYENLVQDLESWSRMLLDFLDLPWHPDCLSFHESARTVRTYSEFQVRKPIYSSSIGRWKNYETHLEPLRRGLRWSDYHTGTKSPA